MRIFKTKTFNKWAQKSKLKDSHAKKAIAEILLDRFDANLGGNIYKKRIAIGNKGKKRRI